MSEKKSYNPFKMWGSWVGILLGLIVASSFLFDIETKTVAVSGLLRLIVGPFIILFSIIFGCFNPAGGDCAQRSIVVTLAIITFLAVSFLAGWAIHSLVRKLKTK